MALGIVELSPTFCRLASVFFYLGDKLFYFQLIQDNRGFGERPEFYILINGYRLRHCPVIINEEEARRWYMETVNLYREAFR